MEEVSPTYGAARPQRDSIALVWCNTPWSNWESVTYPARPSSNGHGRSTFPKVKYSQGTWYSLNSLAIPEGHQGT